MTVLTEQEYSSLCHYLGKIGEACKQVSGYLEEASSILIGVEDRTGGTGGGCWATPIHVDMGLQREPIDIIEEKARKTWFRTVTNHRGLKAHQVEGGEV